MFFLPRYHSLVFLSSVLSYHRSSHYVAMAFVHHKTFRSAAGDGFLKTTANLFMSSTSSKNGAKLSSESAVSTATLITMMPGITTEAWNDYESAMREVTTSERTMKKKLPGCDSNAVIDYLLSNQCFTEDLTTDSFHPSFENRTTLKEQRLAFLNVTGFGETQYEFCLRCLTYLGDFCAKRQIPRALLVGWYKLKESAVIPRENGISTYMYALTLDESCADMAAEVASFHDLLYPPNEKTITLRVKSLIAKHDAASAEQILASLPDEGETSNELRRLRTYMPILSFYCAQKDFSSILRVFRQMRISPGTYLDADAYALVVGTLARNGCFRDDSKPIDGAVEQGFSATHGPTLFDNFASEMGDDLLELTPPTALILRRALLEGFSNRHYSTNGSVDDDEEDIVLDNSPAELTREIADRVIIDNTTALCPKTSVKLRLFVLDNLQRRHVHDTLLTMADSQHREILEKIRKLKPTKPAVFMEKDYALKHLANFAEWLDKREGPAFTAFVDGPNVAYFGHGDLHYSQIDLIVDKLVKMGENPLVVMAEKYTMKKFHLSTGYVQVMKEKELEILERMRSLGMLYVVPSNCLDDYYWMLGSVSNQTTSLGGADISVWPESKCGGFPGLRPILVTNDQMRDHRLALLEPRLFHRWRSSHIVNYNISHYVDNEWEDRIVQFTPADFLSREIQGNEWIGSGQVWHFPVEEWGKYDRLCVHIPLSGRAKDDQQQW